MKNQFSLFICLWRIQEADRFIFSYCFFLYVSCQLRIVSDKGKKKKSYVVHVSFNFYATTQPGASDYASIFSYRCCWKTNRLTYTATSLDDIMLKYDVLADKHFVHFTFLCLC